MLRREFMTSFLTRCPVTFRPVLSERQTILSVSLVSM